MKIYHVSTANHLHGLFSTAMLKYQRIWLLPIDSPLVRRFPFCWYVSPSVYSGFLITRGWNCDTPQAKGKPAARNWPSWKDLVEDLWQNHVMIVIMCILYIEHHIIIYIYILYIVLYVNYIIYIYTQPMAVLYIYIYIYYYVYIYIYFWASVCVEEIYNYN